MFGWLLKLFGINKDTSYPPESGGDSPISHKTEVKNEATIQTEEVKPTEEPPLAPEEVATLKILRESEAAYLTTLVSGGTHTDLQKFLPHDRAFLSLLMRKANSGDLQIPLLPEAAIKLRKLMRSPEVNIGQFVDVFKNDPALSAEILKVANSPFYGFETHTHDLGQAVTRIGYNQVRAVVMMMSLRSKVLHAGSYGLESELIATLAIALARACSNLAKELGVAEEEAFTRGLLAHLDLFVIFGVAAEFNAGHKEYNVSREAIAEAVGRVGSGIRRLVEDKWGLDNLGYTEKESEGTTESIRATLSGIGLAVITAWAGRQMFQAVPGINTDALSVAALASVGAGKK